MGVAYFSLLDLSHHHSHWVCVALSVAFMFTCKPVISSSLFSLWFYLLYCTGLVLVCICLFYIGLSLIICNILSVMALAHLP